MSTRKPSKPVICIDFDRVVHAYSQGWRNGRVYDEPVPGAIEGLQKLTEQYTVVILTAFSQHGEARHRRIERWLLKHGVKGLQVTSVKPPAVAYVDDRAHLFVDWAEVLETFCANGQERCEEFAAGGPQ